MKWTGAWSRIASPLVLTAFGVLVVFGLWKFSSRSIRGRQDPSVAQTPSIARSPPSEIVQLDLDLRTYNPNDNTVRVAGLVLARKRLHATILLPDGSQRGEYELRVEDSRGRLWMSARGRVEDRESIPTLRTTLDLSSLTSGEYRLAIRPEAGDWRLYRVQLE